MIGHKGVMDAGIGVLVANTTKPDGAMFCPGAGELNGLSTGQTFGFEHSVALTVAEPAEAMTRYRALVFNRVTKEMSLSFSWLYQA